MGDRKKKYGQMGAARFWFVIWGMGLAGQICWNIENQWFNTFVYAKISGDVNIVTSMVMAQRAGHDDFHLFLRGHCPIGAESGNVSFPPAISSGELPRFSSA